MTSFQVELRAYLSMEYMAKAHIAMPRIHGSHPTPKSSDKALTLQLTELQINLSWMIHSHS